MNNFKPRNLLLVLALVLAVALSVVIFLARSPESQVQSVVEALPKGVDVALQDIDYTHIEEGVARWRMVAHKVERQAASGTLAVKSPSLSFFDELGESAGSMQAEKGAVTEDYQKVELIGDVVLQDAKGYSIYAESLGYDHSRKLAATDSRVRIEARGLSLEGTGMTFDVEKKLLRLNADVKGFFNRDN